MRISRQNSKVFEIVTIPEDIGHLFTGILESSKSSLKILKLYPMVKLMIALKIK